MAGRVHGDVERVASDDLVQVRRVGHARVHQGVDAVDDELGAREAQHVELRRGVLRQQHGGSEGCQLHREDLRFLPRLGRGVFGCGDDRCVKA